MNDLRYALRMLLKSPGFSFTLTGLGDPVQIFGGRVTANYFAAQPFYLRPRSDGLPLARAPRWLIGSSIALGINRRTWKINPEADGSPDASHWTALSLQSLVKPLRSDPTKLLLTCIFLQHTCFNNIWRHQGWIVN
jgi:hypothetical protein